MTPFTSTLPMNLQFGHAQWGQLLTVLLVTWDGLRTQDYSCLKAHSCVFWLMLERLNQQEIGIGFLGHFSPCGLFSKVLQTSQTSCVQNQDLQKSCPKRKESQVEAVLPCLTSSLKSHYYCLIHGEVSHLDRPMFKRWGTGFHFFCLFVHLFF